MEPTDFRPPELRHSMSVHSANLSSGSFRANRPSFVGTSSSQTQPQGFMGHRGQRMSGNSTTYNPSKRFSSWQEAPSSSLSTPMAPHHTIPVDPSPRPSHTLPTIPEPGMDQNFLPSVTPEVAKAQVRKSRGSHDSLTRDLAGKVGGGNETLHRCCKRGYWIGRLSCGFQHHHFGNNRIMARRGTPYGSRTNRIVSRRYNASDSPVAFPTACADTVILAGWVYNLVITSPLLYVVPTC